MMVVVGQVDIRGSLQMVGYNDQATRNGTVLLHRVGGDYSSLGKVLGRYRVGDPTLPEAVKKSLEDRQIGVSGKPRVVKRDRRPVHCHARRQPR